MTKGKLYLWTEMNKQLQNNSHLVYDKLNHDTVEKVENLLGEAKKEFPIIPLNHPEELTSEDYFKELAKDRLVWFNKYFGGVE